MIKKIKEFCDKDMLFILFIIFGLFFLWCFTDNDSPSQKQEQAEVVTVTVSTVSEDAQKVIETAGEAVQKTTQDQIKAEEAKGLPATTVGTEKTVTKADRKAARLVKAFKQELNDDFNNVMKGLGVVNDNIGYLIQIQDKMIQERDEMFKALVEIQVASIENQNKFERKLIEMSNRFTGIEEKLDMLMQKMNEPKSGIPNEILENVMSTVNSMAESMDKLWKQSAEMVGLGDKEKHSVEAPPQPQVFRFDKYQLNDMDANEYKNMMIMQEDQKLLDRKQRVQNEPNKHKDRNPVLFVYPTDEDGNLVYRL